MSCMISMPGLTLAAINVVEKRTSRPQLLTNGRVNGNSNSDAVH